MTAYEMRMSDWSSDVCSSDLIGIAAHNAPTTVRESPIVRTPFARNSLAVALALALPFALVACKQPAANPDTAAAAAATAATSDQQSETARLNAWFSSEARRVGKEFVSTCTSRVSPSHSKNKQYQFTNFK